MEQRVSLITLGVGDLARARQFYTALGWTPATADTDDVVFFQAGCLVLGLWDRAMLAHDSAVPDSGGWGGVTLAYNVRSPAEVDAAIEEARAAGAVIGRERRRRSGADTRDCSSTPTGTRGKSPTIPAGRCCPTAA